MRKKKILEDTINNMGTKIRRLRKLKKMTQKEMAQLLGITETQQQRYEYGEQKPTYENLIKLAKLFDVSCDYLILDELEDKGYFPIARIDKNMLDYTKPLELTKE